MEKSHQDEFTRLRSSQASLEYLLIVALTFAIIVPTAYLFYNYSKELGHEAIDAQMTQIGRSIIDTAEVIFYSGQSSKTVLDLNIPDNVGSAVIIDGRELAVNITTLSSNCDANICKIPELASSGFKKVKIETSKNSISIEVI